MTRDGFYWEPAGTVIGGPCIAPVVGDGPARHDECREPQCACPCHLVNEQDRP